MYSFLYLIVNMMKLQQSTPSSSTYLCKFVRPLLGLRSTIRNAKSIHNKTRQRLTQDTYRRNSRRYLQQKGGRFASPRRNSKSTAKSPLTERKNQGKENMITLTCFQCRIWKTHLSTLCNKLPMKPPITHVIFVIYTPKTTSPSRLAPVQRAR